MANKRISIMKIKQLIRLYTQGKSINYISQQLGISRNTIAKYLTVFTKKNVTYDQVTQMSDIDFISLFEPTVKEIPKRRIYLPRSSKSSRRSLKSLVVHDGITGWNTAATIHKPILIRVFVRTTSSG